MTMTTGVYVFLREIIHNYSEKKKKNEKKEGKYGKMSSNYMSEFKMFRFSFSPTQKGITHIILDPCPVKSLFPGGTGCRNYLRFSGIYIYI